MHDMDKVYIYGHFFIFSCNIRLWRILTISQELWPPEAQWDYLRSYQLWPLSKIVNSINHRMLQLKIKKCPKSHSYSVAGSGIIHFSRAAIPEMLWLFSFYLTWFISFPLQRQSSADHPWTYRWERPLLSHIRIDQFADQSQQAISTASVSERATFAPQFRSKQTLRNHFAIIFAKQSVSKWVFICIYINSWKTVSYIWAPFSIWMDC